jgi:hypothetical protein
MDYDTHEEQDHRNGCGTLETLILDNGQVLIIMMKLLPQPFF